MNIFSITKSGHFFYKSKINENKLQEKDITKGHAIKWTDGSLVILKKDGYCGIASSLYEGGSIIGEQ